MQFKRQTGKFNRKGDLFPYQEIAGRKKKKKEMEEARLKEI